MKMEIKKPLEPFFGWQPKLLPVLPDLGKRVRAAIFWCEIRDVVAVSVELFRLWPSRQIIFWESLVKNFGRVLEETFSQERLEELASFLQERLPFGLQKTELTLDDKLWLALKNLSYGLGDHELEFTLRREMRLNLWYSLFFAAGFRLAGDKSKNFQPLFTLWLKGNFPAWFDRQQRLIILCAANP